MKTLTEETELMKCIAERIQSFYDYCGYKIDKPQIIELCKILHSIKPDIDIKYIDSFLLKCKKGQMGMIYQSPISLMVAFNQFRKPEFIF